MIKAKLINSDASLNDFTYPGAIEFIPGENVKVAVQLFLSAKDIRYIPPVAGVVTLKFLDKDGNVVSKTPTVIDANDRSMWVTTLSQSESQTLEGQNIEGSLDVNGDGTLVYKFIISNVIQRINLAGDC